MARVVPGGGAQVGVQMMPGCPGPSGTAKCEEQGAPTSGLCHIDDTRFADPLHLVNSSGDYTGVPLGGVGVGFFDYAPDGEIKRVAINNAHQDGVLTDTTNGSFLALFDAEGGEAVVLSRNSPRGAAGAAGLGEAHRRLQDARWAALLTPSARCAQAA